MKKWPALLLLSLLISGCNQQNDQTAYDQQRDGDDPRPINVQNSEIQHEQKHETSQEISRNLVRIATAVPNVEDATAVVLGKYAFVGIDVDSAVERSEVGTIKYSVAEALKDDPHGAQAMIVADPDLYARLQEVGSDIENGRPVQGVLNELSDIAGRLMPELPKNTQQMNPDKAPGQSTNKADEQDERQLEEEQQDQSNNHMEKNNNN
ncbi:YhcN/YlaJ family sporulation lipoprotein [Rossellomorea vietnamensis]|uniref:YhcN/YlaJ family sporulation lipoprotein n=1 Tax=Rossellomorea vietnamensis TaxID=218284 RepID=A0A5D4MAS3_9BACI|nr:MULTISPECIES: YhcN/YlaJ family sporulation lipoprotein [Bacillaceae]TYR98413.1 YhcN/YlaJ family sporulation lipoprotein [Rossellomorea vietnamensis]